MSKMRVVCSWGVAVGALVLVVMSLEPGRTVQAADPAHRVSSLPGQPAVRFGQYAGYVTVDEEKGKALFYWLVEADHLKASTMPISFWFNGGKLLFSLHPHIIICLSEMHCWGWNQSFISQNFFCTKKPLTAHPCSAMAFQKRKKKEKEIVCLQVMGTWWS
jgi:hypothetical protein